MDRVKMRFLGLCALASAHIHCTKKPTGTFASIEVFSCSVKKGETRQTCVEFKGLSANEVAYFKQKCTSDSPIDVATWTTSACATEARQGGCELKFTDADNNISTTMNTWGYTATSLSAITASAACENVGGRLLPP